MNCIRNFGFFTVLFLLSCIGSKVSVQLQNDLTDAPVIHALSLFEELDSSGLLILKSSDADFMISTQIDAVIGAEAYQVKTSGKELKVTGGNAVGVMYGLLYVKEQLMDGKKTIADVAEALRFAFRALKFNLPWSSYRNGEALNQHTETCRDTNFWHSF